MTTEKYHCFVSAVVYVRNNADTVGAFIADLDKNLNSLFTAHEIICVNDASCDGSAEAIKLASQKVQSSSLTTIHFKQFHGLEIAMQSGTDLAIGDFVFEFDCAETNFDSGVLGRAYAKASEGYDIVSVSPVGKRRISSTLFYKAMNTPKNSDSLMDTETLRLVSRRAINRVKDVCHVVPYRKAVYASSGLPSATISHTPVTAPRRKSQDRSYRIETAVDALLLFTKIGYHLALGLTFFMMAFALFMIVYSFACYFAGITIPGWMTTVLFLSFAFLGLFGILAIVIKYLQLIVNLIFRRKSFAHESIERY